MLEPSFIRSKTNISSLLKFKELNSKLNREVANFDRSALEGTHYLSSHGSDMYEPSSGLEQEAQSHVLGGTGSGSLAGESAEERRNRVLKATMTRLREEDIEHSCGTGKNASSST